MTKDLKDKAIDFKGKKYVLVSDRVLYFNETYPEGSIMTDLVSKPEDDTVVVKATIKPYKDGLQCFTGYSQATWGEGLVNTTSALENAETSAVGGALAFMGSKEKKASDTSQGQLDALTQKYVKDTLAKYPPGDPRRERALRLAQGGYQDTSQFQSNVANTGPNGRELAADIGKLGLTLTGAKVPANFAGKLGLTRSVGANSLLGGAYGALNAIEQGKSIKDVGKSALASGLTSGAIKELS